MADMTAFEQLDSLMREQKDQIHALNETLKEVDIAASGPELVAGTNITLVPDTSLNTLTINSTASGVGETIEPGTQYVVSGVTYTTGVGTEIFNNYADASTDLRNKAAGKYTHVEGSSNGAYADYSHVEGNGNTVTMLGGHVEGGSNTINVNGEYSHVEGKNNTIQNVGSASYVHVEGLSNSIQGVSTANYSHVEGLQNKIYNGGNLSSIHIEGFSNEAQANAEYAHIEGYGNKVYGYLDHVEGYNNTSTGTQGYNHVEGYSTTMNSSSCCHIEGHGHTISSLTDSHVEGEGHEIYGGTYGSDESHVEGYQNKLYYSVRGHIEGYGNTIGESGIQNKHSPQAHIEGYGNVIKGNSAEAHCEGLDNVIEDSGYAHCEGTDCVIKDAPQAHAQNYHTQATARSATATGNYTIANGDGSFTMGSHTIASAQSQFVLGEYNVSNSDIVSKTGISGYYYSLAKYPFIIGNGYMDDPFAETEHRSDAFKIDCDGKIYVGANDGVDVSGLIVTSNDDGKVLTATYSGGVGTYGWAPASSGGECVIVTDTSTSLPNKVVIENNHEYRYLSLTSASTITVSIETIDITKSFYSTIVLHNVSSTDSLSTFVTVSGDSVISNIVFLNENNVDLTTADTVEMLFFANGMANSVMCIAYAYSSATPAPVYPDNKILVIELDANHEDTNVITEHATLASAKSDLDSKYSTDNTKLYKLYVGDNVTTDSVDIPVFHTPGPNESFLFEDTHNLYSVVLGDCITGIGGKAFYNCENLTEISLPETSLDSISGDNFAGTNLPALTIPSGCQYLRITGQVDAIFFGNNLSDLTFDTNGTVYLANDGHGNDDLYSDDGGVFGQASYRDNTSDYSKPLTITFSENVTGIVANSGGYLFGWDAGNITINISNSVTSISSAFLVGVGDLHGTVTVNIDNTSGSITDPNNDNWGAGSTLPANCTINYLRQ